MTRPERPSLLYVVPGHDFLPSAGPTRNVLNQARAMAGWADVALAFRRIVEPPGSSDPRVYEIAPPGAPAPEAVDDAATRGMSVAGFAAYLRSVRRFVRSPAAAVDVVLEKDWMLTGYVSLACRGRGIASVPVKNWIARPPPAAAGGRVKAARHLVAGWLEGALLRRAPSVVAETGVLKRALVERWRLDPLRIEVIGLGVDREAFRPSDPDQARAGLGIPRDATVILYAGVLDRTHDLEPLLRALVRLGDPALRLHVIGDGARRAEYAELARAAPGSIVLHGRVPHEEVPRYIAAADLCAAPYDPSSFPGGEVGYSTLKVREYLSAGRPVATVASGALRELVREGVSGFLIDNDVDGWYGFLRARPSRERLREMGAAAAATELESWDDVSRAFQRLCRRRLAANVVAAGSGGSVAP